MYKYFPHTADDIRQMLDVIAVDKIEDLYADVPAGVRLDGDYEIHKSHGGLACATRSGVLPR